MNIQELAQKIQDLEPDAEASDVARLCLLISNEVDDIDEVSTEENLVRIWQRMNLKVQAATDQHAAMTEELEELARSSQQSFSKDQFWVLIRAIKVQSQILGMYLGEPTVSV